MFRTCSLAGRPSLLICSKVQHPRTPREANEARGRCLEGATSRGSCGGSGSRGGGRRRGRKRQRATVRTCGLESGGRLVCFLFSFFSVERYECILLLYVLLFRLGEVTTRCSAATAGPRRRRACSRRRRRFATRTSHASLRYFLLVDLSPVQVEVTMAGRWFPCFLLSGILLTAYVPRRCPP